MSGDLGSLVVSLTAETAQFKDALSKAAYHMDQNMGLMVTSANNLQATIGRVDQYIGAFGINLRNVLGMAAAGGFAELISNSIETAAHIHNLSEQTGIAADQLAAMKGAATNGGISIDEVAKASTKFSKAIETQNADTGEAAKVLTAMGLSMEEVKTHSPAEQLHLVAERLNTFADGSGKAAAAQVLFGKSGVEILPFLKNYGEQINLAKDGYADYAAKAEAFEKSLNKLKAASQSIVTHYAQELLPILIAVVDGIDRFKNIIIAAVVVFGGLPLATMAATAAYGALSTALAASAIAAEMGMVQNNLLTTSLWGTSVAAQAASGALGALQVAGGLLFAAYAGWQIGSWLSEQFLEAKLAGIAFVDGALTGWENIKYGAAVAWESIKFLFAAAVGSMRRDFADFIDNIGRGFAAIGAGDTAKAMADLAASIRPAVAATAGYAAALQAAAEQRDKAVTAVHDITGAMANDAIASNLAKNAKDGHVKAQLALTNAFKDGKNPAQDYINKLQEQIDALGLSERQLILNKAATLGIAEAVATNLADALVAGKIKVEEHTQALKDASDEYKKGADAAKAYADAINVWSNTSLTGWADGNDALVTQIENLGRSETAIKLDAAAAEYARDVSKASLLETAQAQENYTAALKAEYDKRVALIRSGAEKQAVLDQIDAEVKAMQEGAAASTRAFEETSKSINSALTDGFAKGFSGVKSFAQEARDTIEKMFKNLILKPLLQPVSDYLTGIFQQGSSALSGIFGAGGVVGANMAGGADLSGTIAGGAASNWGSAAGGAPMGGWGGILGAAAVGGAISSQYGAKSPVYGAIAGAGAMVGMAGATGAVAVAAANAGIMAAAMVPVVGWIVAAIALIASFAVKPGGGPKVGSFQSANYADGVAASRSGWNSSGGGDAAGMNQTIDTINSTYIGYIKAFGAKALSGYSIHSLYETDPQGTAASYGMVIMAHPGQGVPGNAPGQANVATMAAYYNSGKFDPTQENFALYAERAVLAALQASQLPDDIAHLLDGLVPNNLNAGQISNVLAYAAAFHALPEAMKKALDGITGLEVTPETSVNLAKFGAAFAAVQALVNGDVGKDVQAMVDQSSQTAIEKFRAQGVALAEMAAKFDGSADAALNLASATATYYQNQIQMLASLEQASAAFHKSIQDAQRSIYLDVLDKPQQMDFYREEFAKLQRLLDAAAANPATADPSTVAEQGNQAKTDLLAWWNLLDDAQKAAQYDWFSKQLATLDAQLTAANQALADQIKAQNDPHNPNSPIGQVKGAFDKFMLDMTQWLEDNKGVATDNSNAAQLMVGAASVMSDAAQTNLAAAQTPTHIDLTWNGSEVTAGA